MLQALIEDYPQLVREVSSLATAVGADWAAAAHDKAKDSLCANVQMGETVFFKCVCLCLSVLDVVVLGSHIGLLQN